MPLPLPIALAILAACALAAGLIWATSWSANQIDREYDYEDEEWWQ